MDSSTTKEGVTNFQRQNNIPPTGEADVATLATIIRKARTLPSETGLSAEKLAQLDRSSKLERVQSEKLGRPVLPNRVARGSGILSGSAGVPLHLSSSTSSYATPPTSAPGSPKLRRSVSTVVSQEDSPSPTPISSRPPSRLDDASMSSSTPYSPSSSTRSDSSRGGRGKKEETATPGGPTTNNNNATVFEQLFLRIPTHLPMWVYCAELQEITTLVVISKGLVSKMRIGGGGREEGREGK